MASIFPLNAFSKGYTGIIRLALDAAATGPTIAFPNFSYALDVDEGNDYPLEIDSSSQYHDRVLGFVLGRLGLRGPVKLDRGFDVFLNNGFGPRVANGKLYPFIMTAIRASGNAPLNYNGVWLDSLTLEGRFGTGGNVLMLGYSANGMVTDPKNALASSALAAATAEGTPGVGLSSFAQASVTNGAATTPTIYDGIRAFQAQFSNGLTPDPAALTTAPAGSRIIAGCTPSPFAGMLTLTQLLTPANPLPQAIGTYPITLKIPSGDGSKMLTLDLSCSYDGEAESLLPGDYNSRSLRFRLFGTAANGTQTANYPFAAAVA